MLKKYLGKTRILVPPVGMGVMAAGPSQLALSIPEGARVIRYAIEKGVSFLDTAEYYETYPHIKYALDGLAPAFSQNALPPPVISSKSLSKGYKDMQRAIDDCRIALNMDQIAIFLLHEVLGASDFEARRGAWECLIDAKAKGYIAAAGLSTHHVDVALLAAETVGLDALFPLINIKGLGIRTGERAGAREAMEQAIRAASDRGIGVYAMKVFGGGHLLQDYKKALDYVWNLPGIDSLMIGMGREKDVDDAVAWAEGILPDGYIPDISNKKMFVDRGDCSGCGTCVSRCSSKAVRIDEEKVAVIDNAVCTLCGYCAPICPTRALILL